MRNNKRAQLHGFSIFMIKTTRQILIGALALGSAGTLAQAQEQQTPPPVPPPQQNTIGNPQLKNFELPGTRTVAPPPVQQPAPPAPQPQPQAEQPRAQPAPPPRETRPQAQVRAPEPQPVRPQPPAPSVATPPAPTQEAPPTAAPAPAPVEPPLIIPGAEPEAAAPKAQPAPAAPPAEAGGSFPWLYLLGAALLALLAFFGFRKLTARAAPAVRRAAAEPAPRAEPAPAPRPQPEPIPEPAPAPKPAPAPVASGGIVGIQLRPWLELEFKPDRAAATLTDASVQFELTIRNTGNAPAGNIRIEARMFNAGANQEQEIGAFFGEPVRERTAPAVAVIPARGEIQMRSSVTMPKDQVREITVQGRRLFIPMVAFNVIYDWGNGRSGQTSKSYLVGREAETASEKMGAFRLDLGPRLYRSVGQRQTNLELVV